MAHVAAATLVRRYFTIGFSLGDAFWALSCQFRSTVLQCGARLQIQSLELVNSVISCACFLTGGVCECNIAHRYIYAPLRCRTSQQHRTFIPLSVAVMNVLADPVLDDVGLAGFKNLANAFSLALTLKYTLLPVFWGIRIQPTIALVRVV